MFALTQSMRYYLCPGYVDHKGGIDSLYHLVKNTFDHNPLSGDVFLFISANRQGIKILHWEKSGFVLYQKRLEAGTFEMPRFKRNEGLKEISWTVFILLIEGISLQTARKRKRRS